MVRAKMVVTSKGDAYQHYDKTFSTTTIRLIAVTSGSEENKTWAKYTPCGSVELQINNPDAVNAFELGKEYFVDFTKAE